MMSDVEQVLGEALALGDLGRWQEMADLLSVALRDAPDDPYVLCWLGVAERELDNEGVAYDLFKRCLEQDPIDPHLLSLAGAGLAVFDDPGAEPALRAAALTGPDLPITRLQYGAYLAREGFFDEALEHLRAALMLAPDDPTMHGELGTALALKGDLAGAARAMEDALDLAPDDSWTRVLLGLIYAEQGELEPAAESLLQASRDRPEDGEAHVVAALAAAAAGWADAAEDALARAGYAVEGMDAHLIQEAEERLSAGSESARAYLRETIAPSVLHDRLVQPL
jgi:Flp pilus assembly protein TadD